MVTDSLASLSLELFERGCVTASKSTDLERDLFAHYYDSEPSRTTNASH